MSNAKCAVCGKTAYAAEQVRPSNKEDVVLHKSCFRCAHCNTLIKLGNYAALDGKYYCKPHFKQLFALKGNYNEGFGTEKHSAQWLKGDGAHEEEKTPEPPKKAEPKHEEKEDSPKIVKPSMLKSNSQVKEPDIIKPSSMLKSASQTKPSSGSVSASAGSNSGDDSKKLQELEDKLEKLSKKIQERKQQIKKLSDEVEAMC